MNDYEAFDVRPRMTGLDIAIVAASVLLTAAIVAGVLFCAWKLLHGQPVPTP